MGLKSSSTVKTNMSYRFFLLSLTTFTTILTTLRMPLFVEQQALAQKVTKKNNPTVVFIPPKNAKPKHTTGGASRNQGKCPQDSSRTNPNLTAVIPAQNKGLTIQATPTLLVYLPDTSAQKAFFSISEVVTNQQSSNNHYQTFLPIQKKSGVIQLVLPEDAPKLEIGKTYKWSFALVCNSILKPDSPRVQGLIERVRDNQDFALQLETATSLEKAVFYAKEGLWYDFTTNFVKAYHTQPNNLADIWQDLLNSEVVGLEELSGQPILK